MSIVAVHGPYTFGSKAVTGSASSPLMATVSPTNGLVWDFKLDGATTRVNADFAWTFPGGGTPTPQNVADPALVTYATPGAKTAQCVVTGAGTGATPYPAAGTYTLIVNAVTGTGLPGASLRDAPGDEEEDDGSFDPGDYTVTEVIGYVEDNPDELDNVIASEEAGKQRVTLLTHLETMRDA